jgi:thiol-disulfide isomerase/thioredoxin
MTKTASVITLVVMGFVVVIGALYIYFIDESEVQKRNNTPAAQALIVEDVTQSFTDKEGNSINVNEHFGKIIVVTSWASWCPQCIEGIQALGPLADEYKERDVVVLAVNRGEDKYTAERYLATVALPESIRVVLDPSDHYFKASDGYAMPETIVYSKEGEVALQQRGNVNTQEIKNQINTLLE